MKATDNHRLATSAAEQIDDAIETDDKNITDGFNGNPPVEPSATQVAASSALTDCKPKGALPNSGWSCLEAEPAAKRR